MCRGSRPNYLNFMYILGIWLMASCLPNQSGPCRAYEGASTMRFKMRWALALLPVFALATPAFAAVPAALADPNEPGSVIIFPKFSNFSPVSVDGAVLPRTEIEIGAVCPVGVTCTEHQSVKVRFHW